MVITMFLRAIPILAMFGAGIHAAPEAAGHASADWIASSATVSPGESVDSAMRMRIGKGWHIYWSNPGEGGMKTEFEAILPEGWKAEEPALPAPGHFLTGDLGSFGYEGTVLFPLKLTAPADFDGKAELKMKIIWLACDDGACVPGEAVVTLTLGSGKSVPTPEAGEILEARKRVPHPAPDGLALDVTENDGELALSITGASRKTPDLTEAAAFPVTPRAADPSRVARFTRSGGGWSARIGKSEYAAKPLAELRVLVVPADGTAPFELSWRANSD